MVALFYCWNVFSSSAQYHTKDELATLPDLGIQSCALYEQANHRSENRYKLCSAQVVSQTQIIANSECISKLKDSRTAGSHTLYCGGGTLSTMVRIRPSRVSGNTIITLPKRLPIVPLELSKTFSLSDTEHEKCYIKSANKYLNLLPKDSNVKITKNKISTPILTKSDIGAGVYCKNKQDKEILVGVLDENFMIQDLNQIEKQTGLKIKNHDIEFVVLQKEDLSQICREGINCITSITREASDLTAEMIKILNSLEKQFNETRSISEINELEREYKEIRLRCNQINVDLGKANTNFVDTGILSAAMGKIESAAISSIEGFSSLFGLGEDFLYNQFKNVPIINENMTSDELRKVMDKVESTRPNISSLERIKEVTRGVTKEIVIKIGLEMSVLRHDQQKYSDFSEALLSDFDKCLKIANSKNKILECADKFSTKAAIEISRIELDNQLKDNFEKFFAENKSQYEDLTLSSKDTYYRCVSNNMFKKKAESSEVAKGCVYESILTAYNQTKDAIVTDYLKDAHTPTEEIPNLLKEIKSKGNQCNLGTIINNEGKISQKEFNDLKNLTTEKFKSSLDDCINTLTLTAGRVVTSQTVLHHPQITSAITNNSDLQAVVDTVVMKDYDECIRVQESNKKQDPNNCRDLITATTSLHVAKEVIAQTIKELAQGKFELQNKLTNDVNSIINNCSLSLRNKHLEAIKREQTHPSEKETVSCLNLAVSEISRQITYDTLNKEFVTNPLLIEYKDEITKNQMIIDLPNSVKSCFQEEMGKAKTIDEFSKSVDRTKEKCQLNAEKDATATIAPLIILSKLTEALENKDKSKEIAENYIQGKNGLTAKISAAKSKEELSAITNAITKDLTIEGAGYLIPKLVEEMLKDASIDEKSRTKNELLNSLKECLKVNTNTEQCVNKSTALGYEKIGGIIIGQNITNVMAPDPEMNNELISKSKKRLDKCISKIDTTIESEKYKATINLCMIDEIAALSIDLPREAIVLYAPAAGLDSRKTELRNKLLSYEDFYLLRTKTIPERTEDYIINSHISHMSCIASIRYELKRKNETDMTKVQEAYSECTNNVERNIKNGISQIFVKKHLEDPALLEEYSNVANTLIQLTSNEKKPDTKVAPLSEAFDQMHMVGEKFKIACQYDKNACSRASSNTLKEITAFKLESPDATSEEILNKFYETELMSTIIKSEIGTSLQRELEIGMKAYLDKDGILKSALKNITSYESITEILSTPRGKKIKDQIIQAIKDGNIDKIMENKSFRQDFANALIANTGNDSFIDKLMYGVVQPAVRKEKHSSNGAFGIFKNPKVTLGRLLGIVDGKDFDWNKIRNTTQGQKARELFAKGIFAPLVAGDDLQQAKPNNTKKYKSKLDELSDQVQENIVEGIKAL